MIDAIKAKRKSYISQLIDKKELTMEEYIVITNYQVELEYEQETISQQTYGKIMFDILTR